MTDKQGFAATPAFRWRAVVAVDGLVRMLRGAVDAYGDLDSALIYFTVAMASSGAASRDPVLRERYSGEAPLPDEHHRPVSRRAVSLATGLPRETVRRKIALLIAQGHLVEEARGVRTRSDVLRERENLKFAAELVREFERTAVLLARIG